MELERKKSNDEGEHVSICEEENFEPDETAVNVNSPIKATAEDLSLDEDVSILEEETNSEIENTIVNVNQLELLSENDVPICAAVIISEDGRSHRSDKNAVRVNVNLCTETTAKDLFLGKNASLFKEGKNLELEKTVVNYNQSTELPNNNSPIHNDAPVPKEERSSNLDETIMNTIQPASDEKLAETHEQNENSKSVGTFISKANSNDYITEEEIAASLKKKEDLDNLSLNGSVVSASISQISYISKINREEYSLNTLRARKNELITSIRSMLTTSNQKNPLSCEDHTNFLNITIKNQEFNPNDMQTSTPFREHIPPAAKFLKEWKPSFHNLDEVAEGKNVPTDNGYEEAMSSLQEILSISQTTNDDLLDVYSNKLAAYKEEDAKKFDEMMLQITTDKDEIVCEDLEITKNEKRIDTGTDESTISNNDTLEDTLIEDDLQDEKVEIISVSSSLSTKSLTLDNTNDETLKAEEINQTRTFKCIRLERTDVSTYLVKTSVAKDLENLAVGEDEMIEVNVVDEDRLLASDDEAPAVEANAEDNKILPAQPVFQVKDGEIFISDDQEENNDNNDPKWDYIKNLGSAYERYMAVRARWKNLRIPNPKKDLTCRIMKASGKRVNGNVHNYNTTNTRKRLHTPNKNQYRAKKARRESCTIIFDQGIQLLIREVEQQRFMLDKNKEQALNHLADVQQMEKLLMFKEAGVTEARFATLKRTHIAQTENLIQEYNRKLNDIMQVADKKIEALKKASEEVRSFHEFYPNEEGDGNNKDSLLFLSEEEVQEILEVEEMLLSFETFYNG